MAATWDDDPGTREHVWELYRRGPPVAHHRPWQAVLRTGTGYHPQRRPPAQLLPPVAHYRPWQAVLRTGTGYHPQRRPPAQLLPPVAHYRPWQAVLRTGTGYHPQRRPPAQLLPPGAGYDPGAYWPGGRDDPGFHVLRLEPWRIQVLRAHELVAGRSPRVWRSDPPD